MSPVALQVKDKDGAALHVGDEVEDDVFGAGIVRGECPCAGEGFNVIVEWRDSASSAPTEAKGGRGSCHLTKRAPALANSSGCVSPQAVRGPMSPAARRSPRFHQVEMQKTQDRAAHGTSRDTYSTIVQSSGSSRVTMMNFFQRCSSGCGSSAAEPVTTGTCSAAEAHQPSGNSPELASHERARKMKRKREQTGKERGRQKADRVSKESKVSLESRIAEFPNERFKVSGKSLWCAPCAQIIPNIQSSIKSHVQTEKHKKNLAQFDSRKSRGLTLYSDLEEYFKNNPDESMSSLRTEVHVFRYCVVESFLISGTPLERIKFFRSVMENEHSKASLTDASHMRQYIPKIESREADLLCDELSDHFICISFDGTTRLGEAVNVVARYCTSSFQIVSRLIRFITLKHHMKAPQLASLITRIMCTEYTIAPEKVICMARDSVSVNGAACKLLEANPFSDAEAVLCISHTLNNCGARIELDVLNEFMTPWLELVGGTNPHRGAEALWRSAVAPQVVPGFSKTRWYSKAEIQFVLAENFGKLPKFLADLDTYGYGDATRARLHSILDSGTKMERLRLQLAAMLDMRKLVSTTYELEGDRLELLLVYDRIEKLRVFGASVERGDPGVLPNVDAVLRSAVKLTTGLKILKVWPGMGSFQGTLMRGPFMVNSTLYPGQERPAFNVHYSADNTSEDLEEDEIRSLIIVNELAQRKEILAALVPAFHYLEARITGAGCDQQYRCDRMYEMCRVAQVFNPMYAGHEHRLTPNMVDELAVIKPLAAHIDFEKLKGELPAYLSMAERAEEFKNDDAASFCNSVLQFWNSLSDKDLCEWRKAAQIVFTLTPNSASCERVFSLLKCMYGDQSISALADQLQAGLMLRYNKREPHQPASFQ